jgi:hypothetical protein
MLDPNVWCNERAKAVHVARLYGLKQLLPELQQVSILFGFIDETLLRTPLRQLCGACHQTPCRQHANYDG